MENCLYKCIYVLFVLPVFASHFDDAIFQYEFDGEREDESSPTLIEWKSFPVTPNIEPMPFDPFHNTLPTMKAFLHRNGWEANSESIDPAVLFNFLDIEKYEDEEPKDGEFENSNVKNVKKEKSKEKTSDKISDTQNTRDNYLKVKNAKRPSKTMIRNQKYIERKFVCDMQDCQKRYIRLEHYRRHLLSHAGEKKWKCECGFACSRRDNLRQHQKTHTKANQHQS